LLGAIAWIYIDRTRVPLLDPDEAPAASEFTLVDLEGRPVRLQDYHGRVVVLNLWASWCAPCRAEIPGFSRVYDELHDRGLEILGVSVEQASPQSLRLLGLENGMTYPVLRLAGGLQWPFEDQGVIPQSWWIDRRGRLRGMRAGYVSEGALRRTCLELLDES
jgi:thiol-disulfide isomerase/thioredoxin